MNLVNISLGIVVITNGIYFHLLHVDHPLEKKVGYLIGPSLAYIGLVLIYKSF